MKGRNSLTACMQDWSRLKHLISLGDDWIVFAEPRMDKGPMVASDSPASTGCSHRRACDPKIGEGGLVSWLSGWEQFKQPSMQRLQLIDLLLEAIGYCPDARAVMETLSADLFSNHGRLLGRFMRRIMQVAGVEDERLASSRKEGVSRSSW